MKFLSWKGEGDYFSRNFVCKFRATTTHHMISFIHFYFHFLANFQTLTSPHMLSICYCMKLLWAWVSCGFTCFVSYRSGFIAELAILLHLSGNFVQNKVEHQTSIPPTSPQIKDEAARRAKKKNLPFSHPWFGGEGWSRFSIYFVQNKMEQQTPITPKWRVKTREGQKLAISPSRIGGMGGLGLSKSTGF